MAAVSTLTIPFTAQELLKDYKCILNSGNTNNTCNYSHAHCVSLTAISVNGKNTDMTEDNLTRVLQAANEAFLSIRIFEHHKAKPNDEWTMPNKTKRKDDAIATYLKAATATGLTAAAVPSYQFLTLPTPIFPIMVATPASTAAPVDPTTHTTVIPPAMTAAASAATAKK